VETRAGKSKPFRITVGKMPDLKIIHKTYRFTCNDTDRAIALDVTVKNVGAGSLGKHAWSLYVSTPGDLPHKRSNVWVPPLAPGAQESVAMEVGDPATRIGRLPGSRSLKILSFDRRTGKKITTPFTIKLPEIICGLSKPIGTQGLVVSRSPHLSLRKPKLTIRFALASPTNNCDPNRLMKVNVVIRNEGGPLPAHTRSAYVHAVESGGAHLISRHVSLPAISSRGTWQGVLVVGTRKSLFPKLPGWHTLVVSIGPDHAAPGTLAYIPSPSFPAKVDVPPGYCQPPHKPNIGVLMRMRGATIVHGTARGKQAASPRHGMRQPGVRKLPCSG